MSTENKPPNFNKMTITVIWLVLLGATTLIFNSVLDNINNPNKKLTVTTNDYGEQEVILQRNKYGHYVASGEINGKSVDFLLDTGATLVAIPEHIAAELNLTKGRSFQSQTANGMSTSYATTINTLTLGGIQMNNVPASISSGMDLDEILLGMSFLKHLKLSQQGKQLTISIPNN